MNGEDALVTVLFVDIRDFTPFADRATAREAVALLNEFFGVVVPVLEEHGGRVQHSSATGCSACSARPSRCRTTPTAGSPPRGRSWRRSRRTSATAAASASASTPGS